MDSEAVEAFFLNHDDPWFEMIGDAEQSIEAIEIATKVLREAGCSVEEDVVKQVVGKIRDE